MTFPTFTVGTLHSSGTGSTSRNISFGATLAANDGMGLLLFYRDGTVTAPGGSWSDVFLETQSNLNLRLFLLVASGGETSLTLTTQSAVVLMVRPIRITAGTWDHTTAPEATRATFSADPPSETASWGSDDNGWIAALCNNGSTADGFPSGFGDNQLSTASAFDSMNSTMCTDGEATATRDPAAFTAGGADPNGSRSIVATIVFRGASAAGATATPAVISCPVSMSQPAVGSAASPAVISASATVPRPGANAAAGPSAIQAPATVPQPGVGTAAAPAVVSASTTVPRPGGNAAAGPVGFLATTLVPTPTFDGGATASPAAISAVTSLGLPGVNVGVSPATIALALSMPAPSFPGQALRWAVTLGDFKVRSGGQWL